MANKMLKVFTIAIAMVAICEATQAPADDDKLNTETNSKLQQTQAIICTQNMTQDAIIPAISQPSEKIVEQQDCGDNQPGANVGQVLNMQDQTQEDEQQNVE